MDTPKRCRYCAWYVPGVAKVADEWVDAAHCRNWYRSFPDGCDRFVREPGSDDDLE